MSKTRERLIGTPDNTQDIIMAAIANKGIVSGQFANTIESDTEIDESVEVPQIVFTPALSRQAEEELAGIFAKSSGADHSYLLELKDTQERRVGEEAESEINHELYIDASERVRNEIEMYQSARAVGRVIIDDFLKATNGKEYSFDAAMNEIIEAEDAKDRREHN